MIDFVVFSSDLRPWPYVLDTRVKRGAELSTDHHLVVVSWIRWQRRKLRRTDWTGLDLAALAAPNFDAAVRSWSKLWTWAQGLWCLSWRQWRQPLNLVVDTGSGIVDSYLQAKQAAAWDGPGSKNSGLGGVLCGGGELLTSTGDIVGRWKKYFEDLLNPTDLPSNEEAEAWDSSPVTEVVHKLLSGKAPEVDEICPEYLKSLDVVGQGAVLALQQINHFVRPTVSAAYRTVSLVVEAEGGGSGCGCLQNSAGLGYSGTGAGFGEPAGLGGPDMGWSRGTGTWGMAGGLGGRDSFGV
ncbi:hypothetical protein L3Q82_014519 [Scortum barcoo]|uniref:Uncharacterized protein n=1 Tax=Scortum barcoo TaxID=214431 RepID=A0ACB8VYC1_9TELE|nr:hypothetical protein L3Q82_014519 [Scortum barcoo]